VSLPNDERTSPITLLLPPRCANTSAGLAVVLTRNRSQGTLYRHLFRLRLLLQPLTSTLNLPRGGREDEFPIVRNCQWRVDIVPRIIDHNVRLAGPEISRITDGTSGSRGTEGDKRRRGGRTVQVRVRAAVRPNQAACRRKRQFLGTCSRPQSPSVCGTQAKYLLPGRAAFKRRKLEVAPFAFTSSGCPVLRRRGRGETPKRSARPFGGVRSK
jgi:hypothetical protein